MNAETRRKTRPIALILGFVTALIGVILFILFQDMRLPMVLIDRLTIIHAFIFAVEIVCMKRSSKKHEHEEGVQPTTVPIS
jgi:hypothetical protein